MDGAPIGRRPSGRAEATLRDSHVGRVAPGDPLAAFVRHDRLCLDDLTSQAGDLRLADEDAFAAEAVVLRAHPPT